MGLCHQALLLCVKGLYFKYDGLPIELGSGSFTYPELFSTSVVVAHSPTSSDGGSASATTTSADAIRIGASKLVYLRHAGITPSTMCTLIANLGEYVRAKREALRVANEPDASATSTSSSTTSSLRAIERALSQLVSTAAPATTTTTTTTTTTAVADGGGDDDDDVSWRRVLTIAFRGVSGENGVYLFDIPAQKLVCTCILIVVFD